MQGRLIVRGGLARRVLRPTSTETTMATCGRRSMRWVTGPNARFSTWAWRYSSPSARIVHAWNPSGVGSSQTGGTGNRS